MPGPASGRRRAYGLDSGDRIGRYVIVEPLAMGGMAELYVAHPEGEPRDGAYVVIKRTLPHLAQDADFAAMFLKEARLASRLDHPNIATVLDAGEDAGDFYIVLEYVHGYDLRALIRAAAKAADALPLDVAVGIAVQLCAGLHCAHELRGAGGRPLQLVHRDVTPSNVLLDHDGRVLLTDFGIARALTTMRTTRAGVIKGKLGYMSPEQCRDGHLDRRSDVFSTGVLLYEMTTGFRMFHAGNDFAVLNKITKGEFTKPTQAIDDYPEALESIVLRAVAVDPDERFSSADALGQALVGFANAERLDLGPLALVASIERLLGRKPLPVAPDVAEVARPSAGAITEAPPGYQTSRTALVDDHERNLAPAPERRPPWALAGALALGVVAGGAAVMASSGATNERAPAAAASTATDPPRAEPTPAPKPAVHAPEPSTVAADTAPLPELQPTVSPPAEPSATTPEVAPTAPRRPAPKIGKRKRKKARPTEPAPDTDAQTKILPPSMLPKQADE